MLSQVLEELAAAEYQLSAEADADEESAVRGEGGGGVKEAMGACSSSLGTGEDVAVSAPSQYGPSVVVGDDAESKAVVAVGDA